MRIRGYKSRNFKEVCKHNPANAPGFLFLAHPESPAMICNCHHMERRNQMLKGMGLAVLAFLLVGCGVLGSSQESLPVEGLAVTEAQLDGPATPELEAHILAQLEACNTFFAIIAEAFGVRCEATFFVPKADQVLLQDIKVTNISDKAPRNLMLNRHLPKVKRQPKRTKVIQLNQRLLTK